MMVCDAVHFQKGLSKPILIDNMTPKDSAEPDGYLCVMHHLTQGRQGIFSIELGGCLSVMQMIAWATKHNLKQVMLRSDGARLPGGKRSYNAPGKKPFVAAAEPTPKDRSAFLKLSQSTSFCSAYLPNFAKARFASAHMVIGDGLQSLAALLMLDACTKSPSPAQVQSQRARLSSSGSVPC